MPIANCLAFSHFHLEEIFLLFAGLSSMLDSKSWERQDVDFYVHNAQKNIIFAGALEVAKHITYACENWYCFLQKN